MGRRKKGVKTAVLTKRKARNTAVVDQVALKADIDAAAAKLRSLKNSLSQEQLEQEIFSLLELKYLSTEHRDECYALELDRSALPAKMFKVRWHVIDVDGSEKRIQRPFIDRTSITGEEVIDAVIEQSARTRPNLCAPIKFEMRARETETGTGKIFKTLSPSDKIRMPLISPGPRLADVCVVELRVTFPAAPTHITTPPVYAQLPALPHLIDCGVNMFEKVYARDVEAVIDRGFGAGVAEMVLISTNLDNAAYNLSLAASRSGSLYSLVGVHPYDVLTPLKRDGDELAFKFRASGRGRGGAASGGAKAKARKGKNKGRGAKGAAAAAEADATAEATSTSTGPATPAGNSGKAEATSEGADGGGGSGDAAVDDSAAIAALKAMVTDASSASDSIVGIGECGLDYSEAVMSSATTATADEFKAKQKWYLEAQLSLAAELGLPVLLHEREAFDDFFPILERFRPELPAVVINCFSGSEDELKAYIGLDVYIGVTGLIANDKRGGHLRGLLSLIPPNRIVLGSDAPYMLPYNMGKPFPKRNEPGTLPFVLVDAAECLGVSVEDLAASTTTNCVEAFPRLVTSTFNGTIGADSTYVADVGSMLAAVETELAGGDGGEGNAADGSGDNNAGAGGDSGSGATAAKKAPLLELEGDELVERLAEQGVTPDGDGGFVVIGGGVYKATRKEMNVLAKQKASLESAAFQALALDFELERVTVNTAL